MPATPDELPQKTETPRTGVIGPGEQTFDSATCENAFGATAAPRYRQWEYDLVSPYLGRSILEIGSGMGYFAEKLATSGRDRLVLSDPDRHCLERLRQTYADRPDVEVVELALPGRIDIGEPVESAVAMNVLEHIEDDAQALRDLAAAVVPGGRIILWVPAYMQLYGDGSATRDFLYVDDLCDGICAAVEATLEDEVVHLASGEETSIGDLARLILELVGTEDVPVRYEERRRGEIERTFAKPERAAELLGFAPAHSLVEGMRKTVDWFVERERAGTPA